MVARVRWVTVRALSSPTVTTVRWPSTAIDTNLCSQYHTAIHYYDSIHVCLTHNKKGTRVGNLE